jgi:hypothetical protein
MNHIERDHQTSFFCWLRANEARFPVLKRFFAIPNGGRRDRGTAIGLFKEGVKRGVLDTFLPAPRFNANGDEMMGLWIEFKAGKNDLTPDQRDWKDYLEDAGYAVHVVRDWVDAARLTVEYLGLKGVPMPQ